MFDNQVPAIDDKEIKERGITFKPEDSRTKCPRTLSRR